MPSRAVTERDFRRPEFLDAKPEDYEFRADGQLVRKDRWERAIGSIRHLVGVTGREFEIDDVVDAVRQLSAAYGGWLVGEHCYPDEDMPNNGTLVEIRLTDGSVLRNAAYDARDRRWFWRGAELPLPVAAWREQQDPLPDSILTA